MAYSPHTDVMRCRGRRKPGATLDSVVDRRHFEHLVLDVTVLRAEAALERAGLADAARLAAA